ncbi:MAG: hypothetical protein Q4C60_12205, partial [Eubacteriales bacterium]|nr:hypothetical protein [Eubacteriales bacterium]
IMCAANELIKAREFIQLAGERMERGGCTCFPSSDRQEVNDVFDVALACMVEVYRAKSKEGAPEIPAIISRAARVPA